MGRLPGKEAVSSSLRIARSHLHKNKTDSQPLASKATLAREKRSRKEPHQSEDVSVAAGGAHSAGWPGSDAFEALLESCRPSPPGKIREPGECVNHDSQ